MSTPAQNVEKFDLSTNITAIRLGFRTTGTTRIKNMREDVQLTYNSLARIKNGEAEVSNEKGKYLMPTQESQGGESAVSDASPSDEQKPPQKGAPSMEA